MKIDSENKLINKIDTEKILPDGSIPYLEKEDIDYDLQLPFKQIEVAESIGEEKKSHDIYFYKCDFNENVKFKDSKGLIFFDNCTFHKDVNLSDTNFKHKIRFRRCTFESEVKFNNTTFHDLADFWRCTFEEKTVFFKTDFLNTTVFSGATFEENTLFTYSVINKLLILRRTTFEKGLDLSLANTPGELNLFDIRLNDFESENDIPDNLDFEDGITSKGIIYTANKRETFRIIKHNFLSKNDSVSAQKFSLLESITHRKEKWHEIEKKFSEKHFNNWIILLKRNIKKGKLLELWFLIKKNQTIKNIWDYVLLSLNRLSNNHKTSYVRGFGFTLFFGLIIFIPIAYSTQTYAFATNFDQFDFGLAVSHFVRFLTPTHDFKYIDDTPPDLFYFFDFIGRIIIAYGIYQTIQAFRKFR